MELQIEYVPTGSLHEYKNNAKKHPKEQIEQIKDSIRQFGMNDPIAVWKDNVIIEGHGRLKACEELGIKTVPVIRLENLTDEQRRAYMLAHNQLTMNTGFEFDILESELQSIDDIDMSLFGFDTGYAPNVDTYENDEKKVGALVERYIVPPFSVLDTRQGYWQDRKRMWLEKTGDLSDTRDGKFGRFTDGIGVSINGGTSNFDPVLAETMYRWFCVAGGTVLDPFAGEQTKGVVAGELGLKYHGVEIRNEQVLLDRERVTQYDGIEYFCGDSNNIGRILNGREYDMLFTSPPYYDLEVYSKEDLSALGTYEEFIDQCKNIYQQCFNLLKEDTFAVIKVGEIRNQKTGEYRSFVADTINTFREIGFKYYNEIILLNAVGTLRLRVNRSMKSRKIGKMHQNVLVFYKGDLSNIVNKYPVIEFPDIDDEDGEENESLYLSE